LAKSVAGLVRKLECAMMGSFSSRLKEIGLPLAQKVSFAAQNLGNISAIAWMSDSSFVIFLAVMHLNNVKTSER
jgi:hypothetical protein